MLKVNPHVAARYVRDRHEVRKSGGDPLHFRIKVCPNCGYTNWATTFDARLQVFYGFCCSTSIPFLKQVQADLGVCSLRGALSALSAYGEAKFTFDMQAGGHDSLASLMRSKMENLGKEEGDEPGSPGIDLSSFSADWTTSRGKEMLEYAVKRKVPEWFMETGRVGYFQSGFLYGRLSFLVVEDGRPVFAVGRSLRKEQVPKYLCMMPRDTGGVGASDVVFNLDLVRPGGMCIICEGVLSALSAGEGAVATLGNRISDVQAIKITKASPSIVILLREEGVSPVLTQENAAKLHMRGLTVLTADLVNGDPNDDPDQMEQVKESAVPVTRFGVLKARLMNAL
jgi:hypothetical protein